jgi:AcrR family transcriptional regulator
MSTESNQRPYKQVARAQARERTRDALLDAANDEFYEGDWSKASLESLSRKAGVTKQTLLRHFGSKDGLLIQALMRGATQVHDQRWSAPRGDIPGTVDNLLDHYEEWGDRSMRIGALQRGPAMLAIISRAARQFHYDWVEYAFGSWLRTMEGQARIRMRASLIALCDLQSWWILSHDLELPRSEVHAILVELIESAIGAKR